MAQLILDVDILHSQAAIWWYVGSIQYSPICYEPRTKYSELLWAVLDAITFICSQGYFLLAWQQGMSWCEVVHVQSCLLLCQQSADARSRAWHKSGSQFAISWQPTWGSEMWGNVHGLATEKKENRLEKAKRALETQPWRANLCRQGTLK